MLIQIHHQDRHTGESEMVSQVETPDEAYSTDELFDAIREEIRILWGHNPPPIGKIFMICTEKSKYFLNIER